MGEVPASHRIEAEAMRLFSEAALRRAGCDAASVAAITRALMHASLHGVDTHGFRLLPHYLAVLEGGRVNPRPRLSIEQTGRATALLDADDGHGATATYTAMEHALDLARRFGVGAVAIRRSSHFGAAGAYALEAARAGLIGFATCHSDALVRLQGGAAPFHGTNPLAFAFPAGPGAEPWLLDMATSAIPWNRVLLSRATGAALPAQVASDADGLDTTDAAAAAMLAPLGGAFGYKGAGLAGVADLLSAGLSGAPLGRELPAMNSDDLATPRRLGAFVLALDPGGFAGAAMLAETVARAIAAAAASPAAAGGAPMTPGVREWAEARRRRVEGLVIDGATLAALDGWAAKRGLSGLSG